MSNDCSEDVLVEESIWHVLKRALRRGTINLQYEKQGE